MRMTEMDRSVDPKKELIRLNVGGRGFVLRADTLRNRCNSGLLWRFVQRTHDQRLLLSDDYFAETQEYFFERSPLMFDLIYDFYVTGHLHVPGEHCVERYLLEIAYWRIPQRFIATCCDKYGLRPQTNVHPAPNEVTVQKSEFEGLFMGRVREEISVFLDHPNANPNSKWIALCTIALILASVVGLVLGSLKECQLEDGRPHPVITTIETTCIVFFTIEFIIRFTIAPHKWLFVKDPLNLIDLFTILPYYFERMLERAGVQRTLAGEVTGVMLALRVVRVFKIIRLFKLVRYSNPLQLVGATLLKSVKELSFLGLILIVGVVFFSTVMYYIEGGEGNFDSIPAAAWWTVVTMTTIGYGDVVPQTVGGKLVASAASISGIIVLAFPISMLVENFSRQHRHIARVSHQGTAGQALSGVNVGHKISSSTKSLRRVHYAGKMSATTVDQDEDSLA